ncbi:MAG: hypothetical protein JXP34_04040, partial [Planctomycetes bacterium]|nr:hypothetical protein [Planctomycetota bacterium]
ISTKMDPLGLSSKSQYLRFAPKRSGGAAVILLLATHHSVYARALNSRGVRAIPFQDGLRLGGIEVDAVRP